MERVQAVVGLDVTPHGIYMSVRTQRGVAATLLNYLGTEDGRNDGSTWVKWAQERIDAVSRYQPYLTPPDADTTETPPLSEKEITRTWEALTNGIGELPYAVEDKMEIEPGSVDSLGWGVYVADHQQLCHIVSIHDPAGYDQEIAAAICNAGKAVKQLRDQRDALSERLSEIQAGAPVTRLEPDPDLAGAVGILQDLSSACNLGDHIYDIQEREGEGWGGARVTKWGNAVERARLLLLRYPSHA